MDAVRATWKEEHKRSEKKSKMPFKNQKVFKTNHKDFKLILRTDSFFL